MAQDGTLSAEVHVPAGASWFDGHFPGWPVLPGIAQLGMVFELVRHALDGPVRVTEVSRVRFKQMIVPDDRLTVVAESRPGGRSICLPHHSRRRGGVHRHHDRGGRTTPNPGKGGRLKCNDDRIV